MWNHLLKRDRPHKESIRGKVTINLKSEFESHLGSSGRMISQSKSGYSRQNPGHEVYCNACIFNSKGNEVWFGDLDLTNEREKLELAAKSLGRFWVTPEHPYRWEGFSRKNRKDPRVIQFG